MVQEILLNWHPCNLCWFPQTLADVWSPASGTLRWNMWHGSFSLLAFPELLHLNRHGSWCWLKFLSPCKRILGLNFSMTLGRHFYHRFLICLFPGKWNLLTCSQGKVDPSPRQPSVLLPQVTLASLQSVIILFRFESNTPGSQVPGTTFIKLSKWFLWILPFPPLFFVLDLDSNRDI